MFGVLTVMSWALPILPVLFSRAPLIFRLPVIIYLVASMAILRTAAKDRFDG